MNNTQGFGCSLNQAQFVFLILCHTKIEYLYVLTNIYVSNTFVNIELRLYNIVVNSTKGSRQRGKIEKGFCFNWWTTPFPSLGTQKKEEERLIYKGSPDIKKTVILSSLGEPLP